jgi:4-amino-4-deoxy-L-arabinose transferase-like glycosyltransferase
MRPSPRSPDSLVRASALALTGALSILFFALCFFSAQESSLTYDEPPHIAGGVMIGRTGDFRLNVEHPPLVKRLAALPLKFLRVRAPLDDPAWRAGDEWVYGRNLLFVYNDADTLATFARLPIMLLALATGWLIYAWGARLFAPRLGRSSPTAGLLAAALFFTEPNLIAHASLVTYDLALASVVAAAVWAYWRLHVDAISLGALVAFILFMALAPCVKVAAVYLWLLVFLHLALSALFGRRAWRLRLPFFRRRAIVGRGAKIGAAALLLALCGVAAFAGIWASYGFRYRISPGHDSPPLAPEAREYLETFRIASPVARHTMAMIERRRLLPQGYQAALGHALLTRDRPVYMLGKGRERGGFLTYFVVTTLLKTPWLHLAALGLALGVFAWRLVTTRRQHNGARRRDAYCVHRAAMPVLMMVGFFALVSLSRLNIGHRLILMVIPLACLIAGATLDQLMARWGASPRWVVVGAFLAAALVAPLSANPCYVSYFNPFIGHQRDAPMYLTDSNLDWCQDLRRLGDFLRGHPEIRRVNLALFTTSDPRYYGVRDGIDIGCFPEFDHGFVKGPPDPRAPSAISINRFQACLRQHEEIFHGRGEPILIGGSIHLYPPALAP